LEFRPEAAMAIIAGFRLFFYLIISLRAVSAQPAAETA
jgi:hypothetical protein